MRKYLFFVAAAAVLVAQIAALTVFAVKEEYDSQDTVAVNEIVQSVTRGFDSLGNYENPTELDFTVIDNDGAVLYRTGSGLSESVNSAISHRDTILDITVDGAVAGKVIIYNDGAQTLRAQKGAAVTVFAVTIAIECGICLGYAAYLHFTVVKPFKKMKGFAERIAGGNLDIPLEMDRRNLFGAFTESFDIMRSELKKARLAEAQANESKKELVAKLSHDIKTPVASIKAVAEVGLVTAKDENYGKIIAKADQINTLVTNLFTATLEELQRLDVSPVYIGSGQIKTMLENADYLHRAKIPEIPERLVYADALRLQQVFDNIFANSYKYAGTDIDVTIVGESDLMSVIIEDRGGGVEDEEIETIKEKFKRGKNSAGAEGAGLGLYISDYFMKEMNGSLDVENGKRGLKVAVGISIKSKGEK